MGDSGGGLIAPNNVVVGVVSWVVPCARGFPDAYARVYHHLDWLLSILEA